MALSSLAQLQLIRILLLFFVLFDVAVSSVLFLQVGSPGRSVVESIADQVLEKITIIYEKFTIAIGIAQQSKVLFSAPLHGKFQNRAPVTNEIITVL